MVKYFTQNTEYKGTNLDLKFEHNRHGGHKARSHTSWVQILPFLLMMQALNLPDPVFSTSKMGLMPQTSGLL